MIFVEGFRLLFVLAGSLVGYELGKRFDGNPNAAVWGMLLGACFTYVIGGVGGRVLDKALQRAVFLFRNTPPGEVFAASIISTTGMLLGLVLGLPLLVITRSGYALLISALLAWVFGTLGWRLGSTKGRQIVEAANLSRILAPQPGPAEGHALLADGSAIMDRLLLVLGRSGLLPAGRRRPAVRARPRAVGRAVTRAGELPSCPTRPRVARSAPRDVGAGSPRARRGPRDGRRPGQVADGRAPHRFARGDLFDDRARDRGDMGAAGGRSTARSRPSWPPITLPVRCSSSNWSVRGVSDVKRWVISPRATWWWSTTPPTSSIRDRSRWSYSPLGRRARE